MSKLKFKLLNMIASLLSVVALAQVSPNSIWILYEPEKPKNL